MTIRRFILLLTILLTASKASLCQSTSVSATITDSGGQAWVGGTYTFTTAALGQVPITGTLDGSGAFTSLTFPHNSFTSAVGDVWTAKICPDATAPCYTKTVTISGATQSLSATLIPAAISITIPLYPAAITTIRAYADAEIVSTPKGGQYFNTISGTQRQCTTVSGTTCTVWAAAGGTGSVTHTGGNLTLNNFILGNAVADIKDAGFSVIPPVNGGTGVASPTAHSDPQAEGASNFNFIGGAALTGQAKVAVNGADPAYQDSGLVDSSASPVTSTPYAVACNSGTVSVGTGSDRMSILRFQTGASVINMPDHTASGCGNGFAVILINDGAGTLTVNRGGSDTFSIFGAPGGDGATSFPLLNQQTAVMNNGTGAIWEARVNGGAPAVTSTTAVTVTNPTINTDTKMIELSLPAGYLNTLGQGFLVRAGGVYNNTVATSPALTFTAKLCTVSGCGSGTVVSLGAIVSGATSATATTNASWGYGLYIITNATGATGNVMSKGDPGLTIELSNTITAADTVYMDPNTAVSGNIDLTAALFLDFMVAQSVAGASNAYKQLSAMIAPQSNPAVSGAGGGTPISTFTMYDTFTLGNLGFNPAASNNYYLANSVNQSNLSGAPDARAFFASDSLVSGTIVSASMNWSQTTAQVGTSIWTIKLCDFSVNLTCTSGGLLGTIGTINPIAANCATPAAGWCSVTSGVISWTFTAGHVYGIRLEIDGGGAATKSEVLTWNAILKLKPIS